MEDQMATDNLARLEELLEDLFQFGSAALDFGIYRTNEAETSGGAPFPRHRTNPDSGRCPERRRCSEAGEPVKGVGGGGGADSAGPRRRRRRRRRPKTRDERDESRQKVR